MHNSNQLVRPLNEAGIDRLSKVEDYLFYNQQCEPKILFDLYWQVWQRSEIVATGSKAEQELLKSGLVVLWKHKIRLAPQAGDSFDDGWIENQLMRLQPYNQIRVKLFDLDVRASLPYKVLTEVNAWTNHQPFLTQKLYQIIRDRQSFILRNREAATISELVHRYIIDDWEHGEAATHLSQMRSYLLSYSGSSKSLLSTYLAIWCSKSIPLKLTLELQYLLRTGLIRLEAGRIEIANRIYREVFNRVWIESHLNEETKIACQGSSTNLSLKQISKDVKSNFSKLAKIVIFLLFIAGGTSLGFYFAARYTQIQQIQQANQLLEREDYDAAISAYDKLLQTDIDRPHLLWINRGVAWGGLNNYQEMWQSCSTATLIRPQAALAWNCRGEALYHLQQYDAASTAFKQAIALAPQKAVFWLNQSKVLDRLQQPESAIAANDRAIELLSELKSKSSSERRDLAIALARRGQTLLQNKQDRAALTAFEESLKYSSNYLSALQGKGIALYRLGQYEAAGAVFETILQRDDLTREQMAIDWLYLGVSLCKTQKDTAALKAFQRVLEVTTNPKAKAIAQAGCGIR